jgi:hypothetical protein
MFSRDGESKEEECILFLYLVEGNIQRNKIIQNLVLKVKKNLDGHRKDP